MSSAAALARTVLLSLTDESSRRKIGWVLAAIFSPVILVVALLCCLLGGTSEHNTSMVELCFHGGALPENVPAEYRIYMEDMQSSFSKLDELIEEINCMTEGDERLDDTRVKAIFYALFFGTDAPEGRADQDFVDCFVTYEERTRTVTVTDKDGNEVEQEETYTVAVPITDLETVWSNVSAATGLSISAEQKRNADSIYNLVRYGSSTGMEGWIPGADVPYIGADGFCSPIGSGWQSRVTSEFGYRKDPFTGETRGHTGMDLSVPTGTPSPGGSARHSHRGPVQQQLRLLRGGGPRQRTVHSVRPQLQTVGPGGTDGGGGRHCISVWFHRPLHRSPPAL